MKTEKYKLTKTTFEADDESYWEYEEFRDTSATPFSTDYNKFELKASAEPYTDIFYPYDAYVELHVRLVKAADGSAYAANDNIALINPVTSIFTNVEYLINNINVEGELLQNTHIPNLVNGLIHYDDSYAKSIAQSFGWSVDSGTTAVADSRPYNVKGSFRRGRIISHDTAVIATTEEADVGDVAGIKAKINILETRLNASSLHNFLTIGPSPATNALYDDANDTDKDDEYLQSLANRALTTEDNPTYNSGFAFRKSQTLNSKVKVYKIPLRELVPFVKGNNMIWSGCDIELRLTKGNENMIIFRDATAAAGKLQIHKLSLWMPRLRVKTALQHSFQKLLSTPLSTEIMWNSQYVFSKYTSGRYFNDIIYKTSQKITSIYVLVQPKTYTQTTNFSVADATVNFRRGHIQMDSVSFPAREYSLNYDSAIGPIDYTRMYHTLLKNAGKSFTDDVGMQVTYETFGSYFRFLCFDMDEVPDNFYSKQQTVNLTFETEAAMDHTVYVLINFEKTCDFVLANGHYGVTNVRK